MPEGHDTGNHPPVQDLGPLYSKLDTVKDHLAGKIDATNTAVVKLDKGLALLDAHLAGHLGAERLHPELPERPCPDFRAHVKEHTEENKGGGLVRQVVVAVIIAVAVATVMGGLGAYFTQQPAKASTGSP